MFLRAEEKGVLAGVTASGHQVSFKGMRCSKISGAGCITLLKTTELHVLDGRIVCKLYFNKAVIKKEHIMTQHENQNTIVSIIIELHEPK